MSILIGIKATHASGAFYGAEGFGGISMDGTTIDILKEGTEEELIAFAKTEKEKRAKYIKALDALEDDEDTLTEKEYDQRLNRIQKNMGLREYDKLLILEGKILNL